MGWSEGGKEGEGRYSKITSIFHKICSIIVFCDVLWIRGLCITFFISITMLYGTDNTLHNIPHIHIVYDKYFNEILPAPRDIVRDLSNVIWVVDINYYYYYNNWSLLLLKLNLCRLLHWCSLLRISNISSLHLHIEVTYVPSNVPNINS